MAHTVGVIAVPGNILLNLLIDVQIYKLNCKRYEYTIVLGSDGLWNVMSALAIKPLAKLTFLSAATKAQRTYGQSPNEDYKE